MPPDTTNTDNSFVKSDVLIPENDRISHLIYALTTIYPKRRLYKIPNPYKPCMQKRGQLSVEYLTLVGFTLTFIVILTIIQFEQTEEKNTLIVSSQADRIARKLVDTAEEIYFLGEPARTTIKIYMPTNIRNVTIQDQNIIIKMVTGAGISDIPRYATVNMTGNISATSGIKYITVKAMGNKVCVQEQGVPGC